MKQSGIGMIRRQRRREKKRKEKKRKEKKRKEKKQIAKHLCRKKKFSETRTVQYSNKIAVTWMSEGTFRFYG